MWVLAAQFGLSLLQQARAEKSSKKQVKSQNAMAVFNAGIQDQLTQANNTVAAAGGALSRFRQSLGNQQIFKNAAKQNEALASNLFRLQEQSQTQGLNTKIQAAEQTGALMAAASAAGIGGSTVDMLNGVIKGREARQLEQLERNRKYAGYDTLQRIAAVNEQAIAGQDDTVFLDRVTQVKSVPNLVGAPDGGNPFLNAGLSVLGTQAGIDAVGKVGTGLAGFFKSQPSSGAALQTGGFNPVTGVETPVQMPSSWFKG